MHIWVKYDFDDPNKNDEFNFKLAQQAPDMYSAIWDFKHDFLRRIRKYRELETEEATALINEIYEQYGKEFGKFE